MKRFATRMTVIALVAAVSSGTTDDAIAADVPLGAEECTCFCRDGNGTQIPTTGGNVTWIVGAGLTADQCDEYNGRRCRRRSTGAEGRLESCALTVTEQGVDEGDDHELAEEEVTDSATEEGGSPGESEDEASSSEAAGDGSDEDPGATDSDGIDESAVEDSQDSFTDETAESGSAESSSDSADQVDEQPDPQPEEEPTPYETGMPDVEVGEDDYTLEQ